MIEFLTSVLFFLVAIIILVAVHEFGHFWVAKSLGVKVLRYSIGFGKPLFTKKLGKDDIEFRIAAIPLGGYVKMLDEREGDVAESDVHRAFNRQTVAKRFAIVFAGPAFNFIFAVFAYWLMFVVGVTDLKPVIGDITNGSPAQIAGLEKNQEIISINGVKTPIWDIAYNIILTGLLDRDIVKITVKETNGQIKETKLDFRQSKQNLEPSNYYNEIGIAYWRPSGPPIVAEVVNDSPAKSAGFKINDILLSVDGNSIKDSNKFVEYIRKHAEKKVTILVKRDDLKLDLFVYPEKIVENGKAFGRIGLKQGNKYPESMKVVYQFNVLQAVNKALNKTWQDTKLTLRMFGKMLIGEISLKNISGPVTIAQYAGLSANAGFSKFMRFLAIVSLSLGLINLFPIPILDGGHLFYYMIEIIKGSPVSSSFEAVGQRVGIVLLLLLMSLAFYNDLSRLFG